MMVGIYISTNTQWRRGDWYFINKQIYVWHDVWHDNISHVRCFFMQINIMWFYVVIKTILTHLDYETRTHIIRLEAFGVHTLRL